MARSSPVKGLGLAFACAIAVVGCREETDSVAIIHRFVDEFAGEASPATATILDDTRYVIRGHPAELFYLSPQPVRAPGRLTLDLPVQARHREAPYLLLRPYCEVEGRWIPMPVKVVQVPPAGRNLRFALRLPAKVGSKPFRLRIHSVALPARGASSDESGETPVPAGAVLHFGIGVLEDAWSQGPVRFRASVCESERCRSVFEESLDPRSGWQDYAISLADFEGLRVRFRFEQQLEQLRDGAGSLPLWSNPTLRAPAQRPEGKRDLLLISLDTLRADHLPAYGYPRDTAPFLSELAARGTVFETAVTAATTTAPAHMSMFTGLLPSVHSVRSNFRFRPLSPAVTTLADALRDAGFETGAVTENAAINRVRGFQRGFDHYVEIRDVAPDDPGSRDIDRTLARALHWLERDRAEPGFLFVHTYEVHTPYDPPEAYASLFPMPIDGFTFPEDVPPRWHPDRYDREIRLMDDRLRSFFEAPAMRAFLERAIVVITSDHGEQFLEHGFLAHGADIHEENLRVPLIFLGPGVPAGRRSTLAVSHVDLMPTLLELVGVDPPESSMGRSFASAVRGEPADPQQEMFPIYSEAWNRQAFRGDGIVFVPQPSFAVRIGDRKLLRYPEADGFRYAYHDLAHDPDEREDLYARDPAAAADLKRLLDSYQARTALLAESISPQAGDPSPPSEIDPEREAKLRALGYVE